MLHQPKCPNFSPGPDILDNPRVPHLAAAEGKRV